MNNALSRLTVILCSALLLGACSSTGYSTSAAVSVPKTIRSPRTIPPELAPHVPKFVDALQQAGFSVGYTDDPDALDLVLEFNGNPFNMRVSAGLWRQGVPLLTSSATNSGFGTAIARGSAVESLSNKAVEQFRNELISFISIATVVPDKEN